MPTDLKDLVEKFNCWRQETNRGQVPTHLKQQVIELCERYSPEQLASCLGLKKATMRQWQRRSKLAAKSPLANEVDFVTLIPSKSAQLGHRLGTPTLTVELSNGIKLHLSGQSATELLELTSDLARRLGA
jgi:hypothetical protein